MAVLNRKKKEKNPASSIKIGQQLSFGAAEAYKLLRTNLMFSMPNTDKKCKVIGVTSPLESEGKSTTTINLAYSIAETGKRVLIMDCDLRKPSINRYLNVRSVPGLSNVLIGMREAYEVVIESGINDNLFVVPVGDIPPNPSELIGSSAMGKTVNSYESNFDYILIDLPPVNAVVDALVASKFLDGIIVVVSQNYCVQGALKETIRQLEFLQIKILGFVMTKGSGIDAKYGRYKRKYKNNDSYKYGGYYGSSMVKSELPEGMFSVRNNDD